MTCIAHDGTTLAVDSRASLHGGAHIGIDKLHVFEADGETYAAVGLGSSRASRQMAAWVEAGADDDAFPALPSDDADNTTLLVVRLRDGVATMFNGTPTPIPVAERTWALGSGGPVARVALRAGADARTAVEIACEELDCCGGPVVSVGPDGQITREGGLGVTVGLG